MGLAIITLIILIFINAFFAASEIALIGLNDNKVKQLADKGEKKYILLNNLISEPSRFLSTIQIGITLAGFLASAFAADFFAEPLSAWLISLGLPVPQATLHTISVVLITIILAYFTLILGELVPKKLALQKSEKVALAIVRPLTFLFKIFSPVVKFLTISTNTVVRLLGNDPHAKNQEITEEEIRMMVDVGGERGAINKSEKAMINRIFEFNDKLVSNILTHRTNMSVISVDATISETMEVINQHPYSRFPIYEGDVDNIIGVLHVKDLLRSIETFKANEFKIRDLMRKPHFVIETKKIDDLFTSMKKKNIHIAIVLDEYGGTEGIVTIEDIIEEIVGEISSEDVILNIDEEGIEHIGKNKYAVEGIISLYQLEEEFQIGLPVREFDTLNGFLIHQLGHIPAHGENPTITFNKVDFSISKMDDKRIALVIITTPNRVGD
ncbi:hemolysin family protein [Oceanobacillus sp. CAU 1775]